MEEKDNYERIIGIETFLYFLPIIGLILLWKDKNKLSRLSLFMGTGFGLLSLIIMIKEVIKYDLI